jgi:hypothetical protein
MLVTKFSYKREGGGGSQARERIGNRCCVHCIQHTNTIAILVAKASMQAQQKPLHPLCLFLFSAPHTARCFPLFDEQWRIESALEFHPLYCKEDLVLLNTSCRLLFFHRLVTASCAVGEGRRIGRERRERDVLGLFSVSVSVSYSTPLYLSLAALWPSPLRRQVLKQKEH